MTAFLNYLAVERKVSASTQNQARNALLFLYKNVLDRDLEWLDGIVQAKGPRRLPVVLTREEVAEVLRHVHGTPWLMASTMYGTGMRLLECCRLRVKDVDWSAPATRPQWKGSKGPRDHAPRQARQASVRPPRASATPASKRPQNGRREHRAAFRLCREEPKCCHNMGVAMGLSRYPPVRRSRLRPPPSTPPPRIRRPTSDPRGRTTSRHPNGSDYYAHLPRAK